MFVSPVSLLPPCLIDNGSSELIRATNRRDALLRTSVRGYVILSKSNIRYYQVTIFSGGGVIVPKNYTLHLSLLRLELRVLLACAGAFGKRVCVFGVVVGEKKESPDSV